MGLFKCIKKIIRTDSVDLFSNEHGGNFRVLQDGCYNGSHQAKCVMQAETDDGWKNVYYYSNSLGGSFKFFVNHNIANIEWLVDSAKEDYAEWLKYRNSNKVLTC